MHAPIQLVLVTPEIPANTGNIVRLCAATSTRLHLIEPLGFKMDDRALKRAGLDYWDKCEIRRHLTFEQLELEHPQARFLFLTAHAKQSFYSALIRPGDFLVMGPESTGLPKYFLDEGNRRENAFRIPMPGKTRSLNLSTSAGIVVYEALRKLDALIEPTE
ncbi:MAG: tRNA (cytidine(34)-2'-O)-methyltransferase [Deltaproteobacteria bacterium]|nr:tRNA (cytidine(34)-2'-O)-methyltransferase [Deltaproteobacteria bacterium]